MQALERMEVDYGATSILRASNGQPVASVPAIFNFDGALVPRGRLNGVAELLAHTAFFANAVACGPIGGFNQPEVNTISSGSILD